MKTRILTSLLILGALCVATLGASFPTQEAPDKNAQLVEGMKKWLATINPSSHHEKLGQFVGKWDTVFKIYMGAPEPRPLRPQVHPRSTGYSGSATSWNNTGEAP